MSLAIRKKKLTNLAPVQDSLKPLKRNHSMTERIQARFESRPPSDIKPVEFRSQKPVKETVAFGERHLLKEVLLRAAPVEPGRARSVQDEAIWANNHFLSGIERAKASRLNLSESNLKPYSDRLGEQSREQVLLRLGLIRHDANAKEGERTTPEQTMPNRQEPSAREDNGVLEGANELETKPKKLRVLTPQRKGSSSDFDIIKKEEMKQQLKWNQPSVSNKSPEPETDSRIELIALKHNLVESTTNKANNTNAHNPSNKDAFEHDPKKETTAVTPDPGIQNVYDSIGKIKAFVQNSSVIELKPLHSQKRPEFATHRESGESYRSEQGNRRVTEVMHRIRQMAKELKRSRHRKKKSLGLKELTREIDDIIGQIDKIQKGGSRARRRTPGTGKKNKLRPIPAQDNPKREFLAKSPSKRRPKRASPYSSNLVSTFLQDKSDPEYLQIERSQNSRKLKNFKSLIRTEDTRTGALGRQRPEDGSLALNRMQLTSDLNDICKTIDDLEQQELGNTYHRHREEKLKNLMRSSKLADMRRTMNDQHSDSDPWLKTQSETGLNEHLDENFRMKKCPKCTLYFPLEKIASHCRKCPK